MIHSYLPTQHVSCYRPDWHRCPVSGLVIAPPGAYKFSDLRVYQGFSPLGPQQLMQTVGHQTTLYAIVDDIIYDIPDFGVRSFPISLASVP